MEFVYQPKKYFCNQRKFLWGKDLTSDQMDALKTGEIFTLLKEDGITPYCQVFMDSYNQTREDRGFIFSPEGILIR